jgi:hypothetical protein
MSVQLLPASTYGPNKDRRFVKVAYKGAETLQTLPLMVVVSQTSISVPLYAAPLSPQAQQLLETVTALKADYPKDAPQPLSWPLKYTGSTPKDVQFKLQGDRTSYYTVNVADGALVTEPATLEWALEASQAAGIRAIIQYHVGVATFKEESYASAYAQCVFFVGDSFMDSNLPYPGTPIAPPVETTPAVPDAPLKSRLLSLKRKLFELQEETDAIILQLV